MTNPIKRLYVYGEPKLDITTLLGIPEEIQHEIYSLADLMDQGEIFEDDQAVGTLVGLNKRGAVLYIAQAVTRDEKRILRKALALRPNLVIDEALERVASQVEGDPIEDAEAFIDAYYDALGVYDADERVVFGETETDQEVAVHAPLRSGSAVTIKWCEDGSVEVQGAILRRTGIWAAGWVKEELLTGDLIPPKQVLRFIAKRLAVHGMDDLLGYGRAFGPSRDDKTNATLTARSRRFRMRSVFGVILASDVSVRKGKPGHVVEIAKMLRKRDPKRPVFLHQMGKEGYDGLEAVEDFRGVYDEQAGTVTFGAKSTKHLRVDVGAYVLYTERGDGYIEVPVVIGQFEEANDGTVPTPRAVMDQLRGYLKESVKFSKDFKGMSPELVARYFNASVVVEEGQRVEPGDLLYEVDGIEHRWETKADWGVVTRVVDDADTSRVRCEVYIDAWFEGDAKIRGLGKGLAVPAEALGITCEITSSQGGDPTPRMIIGAPGVIKDANAADEYIVPHTITPVTASVTTRYCRANYDLAKLKHVPVNGVREYPEGVKLVFDDAALTVTTIDPNAITARALVCIEASPVGQAVGTSSMTMPQLALVSSFSAGNTWLNQMAWPGIRRRIDALAYVHAVKNAVAVTSH